MFDKILQCLGISCNGKSCKIPGGAGFLPSTVVLSKSNKCIPNDTSLDIQIPPQKVFFFVFFWGSKYQTSAGGPGCLGHAWKIGDSLHLSSLLMCAEDLSRENQNGQHSPSLLWGMRPPCDFCCCPKDQWGPSNGRLK